MNLFGMPTKIPDGSTIQKKGPRLRKVAEDAVKYVYNRGAGKNRPAYYLEREEQAKRFRVKYGSDGVGADREHQGNVQPNFISVFDTVAALGSRIVQWIVLGAGDALGFVTLCALLLGWIWWVTITLTLVSIIANYWFAATVNSQMKYFRKTPGGRITSWHFASWNLRHFDKFMENFVWFARHAISIDENRSSFPRVGWVHADDVRRNAALDPPWLKQVWFSGNHSDIGGSYLKNETRLSEIAL
jgi:hypothetical protein